MQTTESEAIAPGTPVRHSKPAARAAFWGVALVVIGLDQLTKGIVRATLNRGESWPDEDWPVKIKYITNSGAAFGILQEQTVFLVVMAFVGLIAIYLYYRNPPFEHWTASAAIGLMLGGAIGNLIDRVRLGRVTDFIDFDRYPAFNVADSSIFVGVVVLIGGYLLAEARANREAPERVHEDPPADG